MAKEFKVGEYTYTCMKLNAFEQLNLSRKGAPLFIGMANQQWFNVLHAMPQEDLDLMIAVIMPKVQRKLVTGNWGYRRCFKYFWHYGVFSLFVVKRKERKELHISLNSVIP